MPDWPVNQKMPLLFEHACVEVGVGFLFGKAEQRHLVVAGIDAGDGVLPAFGDPGCAVGPDDNAVGRGALAEIDQFERAVRGSSRPSVPLRWPQNQIVPSGAGATSREPMPLATG